MAATPPDARAACFDVSTTREICAACEQLSEARTCERESRCLAGALAPWWDRTTNINKIMIFRIVVRTFRLYIASSLKEEPSLLCYYYVITM